MKEILFTILVILLTPIYIIIRIFSGCIEFIFEVTEPIAESIRELVDNMVEFWKMIFRKKQ